MVKMLLVEPDTPTCKFIRHELDWEAVGIEVCAEASSGDAALHRLLQHKPAIALVNECLGDCSGLELARQFRKLAPDISVILKGRQADGSKLLAAMREGIFDYLTDEDPDEEMVAAGARAASTVANDHSQSVGDARHEQVISQNYKLLGRELLRLILAGKTPEEELVEMARGLDVDLFAESYVLFALYIPDGEKRQQAFRRASILIDKRLPRLIAPFREALFGLVCLPREKRFYAHEFFQALTEKSCSAMRMYLAPPCSGLEDVAEAYQKTLACLSQCHWDEPGCLFSTGTAEAHPPLSTELLRLLEKELIEGFCTRSRETAMEKLQQFQSVVASHRPLLRTLVESCSRILLATHLRMGEYLSGCEAAQVVAGLQEIEDIFTFVRSEVLCYCDIRPQSAVVQRAHQYIDRHYGQALQLADIARHCYITTTYLSKVFKDETGVGVVKYIHNRRIEQAKQLLLSTDSKVGDIGSRVGYGSYKQFSSYFLKIAGSSPTEYRVRHMTTEYTGGSV